MKKLLSTLRRNNISQPTKKQLVHGFERVCGVFVVAAAGYLQTHHNVDTATLKAAELAGATAVYQLALSYLTAL